MGNAFVRNIITYITLNATHVPKIVILASHIIFVQSVFLLIKLNWKKEVVNAKMDIMKNKGFAKVLIDTN